jgi:hypothetical protein
MEKLESGGSNCFSSKMATSSYNSKDKQQQRFPVTYYVCVAFKFLLIQFTIKRKVYYEVVAAVFGGGSVLYKSSS